MNNEYMDKINEMLGKESELVLLKGQFLNPSKHAKKETGEVYYMFQLKCVKQNDSQDAYLQRYNTYHIVIPTDISRNFTDEQIRDLKNNEVLIVCSSRATVRKVEDKRFNNIQLYVIDLKLIRSVVQTQTRSNVAEVMFL